jgi:hypothetical protein
MKLELRPLRGDSVWRTSSAAIVDAVATPASHSRERRASGRQGRFRQVAEPATVLVLLALIVAVTHFFLAVTDYRGLFVHPDNHQFILKQSLRDGLAIGLRDLPNSLQLRAEEEFRPRWLTYLILSIDQKLRLWLYGWLPVHPTLAPASWLVQLVVAPYCLYRLLMNVTEDRLATLAGLAVYISAPGFLSGFTMHFMPGKTLSNTALLVALCAASEAAKVLRPGQLLVEAPGAIKYVALLALFGGLILDEMPIATFIVLPLFFWCSFVPRWPWSTSHLPAFVKNGAFFAIPALAFLVVVLAIAPQLTRYFFGYTFDYLGDTLLMGGNTRTAASLQAAILAGLDPAVLLGNVTTLFGLSLVPWRISPLIYTLNGSFPSGQVTNVPKLLTLLVFFGVAIVVAVKSQGAFAVHLRGLLVALPFFFVFLSLLMVRHIPIVTGYYYGAIFASLFALLIGMLVTGVSRALPAARPVAALAVLVIVVIQLFNFAPLNDGWRVFHNEQLTRERMQKALTARDRRIPISPTERDLTSSEVNAVWAAWKQGRLDRYLRDNGVSAAAVYEVVELQEIDRVRPRR